MEALKAYASSDEEEAVKDGKEDTEKGETSARRPKKKKKAGKGQPDTSQSSGWVTVGAPSYCALFLDPNTTLMLTCAVTAALAEIQKHGVDVSMFDERSVVFDPHITVKYWGGKWGLSDKLGDSPARLTKLVGKAVDFTPRSFVAAPSLGITAVGVAGVDVFDGRIPHITANIARNARAKHANDLLQAVQPLLSETRSTPSSHTVTVNGKAILVAVTMLRMGRGTGLMRVVY